MTVKLSTLYDSDNVDLSDLDNYPFGKFKNSTVAGAKDGTPIEKQWLNDWEGFKYAALDYVGDEASGTIDSISNSQLLNALILNSQRQAAMQHGRYHECNILDSGGTEFDSSSTLRWKCNSYGAMLGRVSLPPGRDVTGIYILAGGAIDDVVVVARKQRFTATGAVELVNSKFACTTTVQFLTLPCAAFQTTQGAGNIGTITLGEMMTGTKVYSLGFISKSSYAE